MRRTSAALLVLLSTIIGCRGSAAQESLVAAAEHPLQAQSAGRTQPAAPEPDVAEPNAPWAIALLSDAPGRPAIRSGTVVVVQANPQPAPDVELVVEDADIHVAFEPDPPMARPAEEKAAGAKSCSGVVNRRS